MAGVFGRATTGLVACTTTAATKLQLAAAANHRVKVPRISVSFEGIVATDAPILVSIYRQTDDGTSSALTTKKDNDGDGETLQTTATHTATVEPTTTDLLDSKLVHPPGRADFGQFTIPGGGFLGVVVDAPNNVNGVFSAIFEE
jgi:hypothetical protein